MGHSNINVGRVSDFKKGEMKAVSVGKDKEILIVNIDNEIFRIRCSLYALRCSPRKGGFKWMILSFVPGIMLVLILKVAC